MITLKDIAEKTGGVLKGDGNVIIRRIMSMHEAQEGDITFLSQKGFEKYLKDTRASAIIVGNDVKADEYAEKNLIIVKNPGIAYAKAAQMFHKGYPKGMGISSLACISKSAEISDTASIYPYVFVGEGSKICNDVVLYPFVHIGEHVLIEDGTILYPHVTVYDDVKIGNGAVIAANSFVNQNVPDYAIVAGIPAKIIRYRFSSDEIDFLLKFKWWEKDIFWLKNNKDLMLDIKLLMDKYNGDH